MRAGLKTYLIAQHVGRVQVVFRFRLHLLAVVTGVLALAVVAQAASSTWNGNTSTGDWNTPGNWSVGGVPAGDGTSDIVFANTAATTANVGTNWNGSGSGAVGSIYANGTGNAVLTIQQSTSSNTTLTIKGGITNTATAALTFNLVTATMNGKATLRFENDQVWNVGAGRDLTIHAGTHLEAPTPITITKAGTGTLRFNANPAFSVGTTTAFRVSNWIHRGGTIWLNSSYQDKWDQLGYKSEGGAASDITLNAAEGACGLTANNPNPRTGDAGSGNYERTFANKIIFDNSGNKFGGAVNGAALALTQFYLGPGTYTANFTGGFELASPGTGLGYNANAGAVHFVTAAGAIYNDRLIVKLSGDGSTLVENSANNAGLGMAAFFSRNGIFTLDHDNAIGVGNSISWSMRELNNANNPGTQRGLLATAGHNVSAGLRAGPGGTDGIMVLGIAGTGTVAFSGNIYVEHNNNPYLARPQMLMLRAYSNAQCKVTGGIHDLLTLTATNKLPLTITGGWQGGSAGHQGFGTIKLDGLKHTYSMPTVIRAGTLLVGGDAPSNTVAYTAATASSGATTLTLNTTVGLQNGMGLGDGFVKLVGGTTLAGIAGNIVTLSTPTRAAITGPYALQVGSALGSASNSVSLGAAIPAVIEADVAQVDSFLGWTGSQQFGNWSFFNDNGGEIRFRSGLGVPYGPITLDGVTLTYDETTGSTILVHMEWAGQPARPEISGVYRAIYRGNSDANPSIWRRIPEFNSLAEANQYGLQVRVKYGAFNGGKWYYLVNSHTMGESFTRLLAAPASAGATTLTLATIDNLLANYATISGTPGITDGTLITAVNTTTKVITLGTATTGALTNSTPLTFPMFNSTSSALDPGGALTFSPDAVDPDVALLADGPYTISRNITVQNNRAVSGKSILGGNTAATSTFSGTITLNKALHVTAAAGGTARFTGDISGAFGLTKSGAGTVVLEGSKSYTGTTVLQEGVLAWSEPLAGPLSVGAGATLSPAALGGVVRLQHDVTLAAASRLSVVITGPLAGSGYGQIRVDGVAGNVALEGAILDVSCAFQPAANDVFWIVDNQTRGTLSGTFEGLPQEALIPGTPLRICYQANHETGALFGGNDVALVSTTRPFQDEVVARIDDEMATLYAKVPAWRAVGLKRGPQDLTLAASAGLTVAQLRGVTLDDEPPQLGVPDPPYPTNMRDDCPTNVRPYVAAGIAPFGFRFFNNEFNYTGWYTYEMTDYALSRGFRIAAPYVRSEAQRRPWPANSETLKWGGFLDWNAWVLAHGMGTNRFDRLYTYNETNAATLVEEHLTNHLFTRPATADPTIAPYTHLMVDIEHGYYSPTTLRQQPFYPSGGTAEERAAFEEQYYEGLELTYASCMQAAKIEGWPFAGIYGWDPYPRIWYGLAAARAGDDWRWDAYGRELCAQVDVIYHSVYCFYWVPENVAYTLSHIDLNRELVLSTPQAPPRRPYYWPRLHGGGDGWRWWQNKPLPQEEQRAMIAMSFFGGVDGVVLWDWSGTQSPHTVKGAQPNLMGGDSDPMVGLPFDCQSEGGAWESFNRYDVVHILTNDTTTGLSRFQRLRKELNNQNYGVTNIYPYFNLATTNLAAHIRPAAEPVAAAIEGLALVRPFEYLLKVGYVEVDQLAQDQFAGTLPLFRRVSFGPWHLVATYDPAVVYGGAPRTITIPNFGGVPGRTLRLPADAETRIFAFREEQGTLLEVR